MKTHLVVALLATLSVLSCAFGDDFAQATPKPTPKKQMWGGIDLFSCSLDLQDKKQVRWYLFHPSGLVSVTMGEKDGDIAGPLWVWAIRGKWLQIFDNDGQFIWQMRPLKVSGNLLTVDNGFGQPEVYEIQPNDSAPKAADEEKKNAEDQKK